LTFDMGLNRLDQTIIVWTKRFLPNDRLED